jgi:hypothetical protein
MIENCDDKFYQQNILNRSYEYTFVTFKKK